MSDRIYTSFDPSALGERMELSQANTIVSVAQTTDLNRTARCLHGKASGIWYAEFTVWGNGDLAGNCSIGIVNSAASLSTYVGGDVHGWGYLLADGVMKSNNASIGTVTAGAKKQVIGIELITDGDVDGSLTAKWYLDNTLIFTQALAFDVYSLAVSLASQTSDYEDTLSCFVNSGQRAFEYPNTLRQGWYKPLPQMPAIRFADSDYIDSPTADVPHAVYDARIKQGSTITIARSLAFWPDKERSTRSATLQCSVINSDGELDWIFENRTSKVAAYVYEIVNSVKTRKAVMQYDGGVIQSDTTVQVSFQDSIAALEKPLQTKLTQPYVVEANANKPWPIVLGAARSVEPLLLDDVNLVYAASNVPVVGLGYIRDKGDPWNPNAVPPDYTISTDRRTITVADHAAPQGVITADFSSVGGGTEPTAADEITDGDGNPFAVDGSNNLINWTVTNDDGALTWGAGYVTFSTTPVHASYPATTNILHSTGLIKGRAYRYEVWFQFNQPASGSFAAWLGMYGGQIGGLPFLTMVWDNRVPGYGNGTLQKVSGTYVATEDTTGIGLYFSGTARGFNCKVTKFTVTLVPDVYTPATIMPIKLEPIATTIIRDIAGIPADEYDPTSAAAIDADTGYSGVGFYAGSEITVRDAMESILESYTACMYQNADSKIAFTRLTAPEDGVSVANVGVEDLLSDISKTVDQAPGLSTRVGYRKNWKVLSDTDFVTDFIDVPRSVRRALSGASQGIVASSVQLAPVYAGAVQSDPLISLLDDPAAAQAEIDRICTIYSRTRAMYSAKVANATFFVGDIITLTYPRYGLQAGRKLLVKSMVTDLITGNSTVTFWGLA